MITSGFLLIEPDAPRPRCFEVDDHSHPNAWTSIKYTLTPQQLEKELSATGWTFFFMAGPIRVTAFGLDPEETVYAALKRGIKAVRQQGCNCLQIESVEMHSFLGIPSVSMSIRPRHIQRGILFAGASFADGANPTAHGLRSNVAATSRNMVNGPLEAPSGASMDSVARFGVDLPAIQGQHHWTPHKGGGAETGPRRSVGLGSSPVTVGQLGSEIRSSTTRGAPSGNRLS